MKLLTRTGTSLSVAIVAMAAATAIVVAAGCSPPPAVDVTQTPPITSSDDIDDWLARGFYLNWQCEPALHDPLPFSAHMKSRVCANDLAVRSAGAAEYPVGSATVQELADATGTVRGVAISRKLEPGSRRASWFWFEHAPTTDRTVIAAGTGEREPQTVCTDCHLNAGQNGGRDFVFTQIQ